MREPMPAICAACRRQYMTVPQERGPVSAFCGRRCQRDGASVDTTCGDCGAPMRVKPRLLQNGNRPRCYECQVRIFRAAVLR